MGYALHGANGYIPLTYSEIESYMNITNTELSPTEVSLIRKLSISYVGQSYDRDPLSSPPYTNKVMKPLDNSDKIKNAFLAFA